YRLWVFRRGGDGLMARNAKRKCGPRPFVCRSPQASMMGLDDGAAYGQPDTHAVGLRRVERLEQPIHHLRIDADPRISNTQPYAIGSIGFGPDDQFPRAIFDAAHRVGSVPQQIEDDLLKLDSIAHEGWELLSELEAQDRPASQQIAH